MWRPGISRVVRSPVLLPRRTFLGLQRTPPPKPTTQALLVVQGLAIVLLLDYGFSHLTNDVTVVRSIVQSAGYWKDPEFERAHQTDTEQATSLE
ncbi:hypothetical protein K431DRAFT_228379 [Polychaeton citri CBS 116435]|uniref:Uncharacterized protein n=1 Tax=Polychaeton citri CBS 116435 TaxID=1314669 RepID=A0A9P4Q597_9PEZI|nr:hypothetical protein K431DRAFT_228379 [Polychaeton citri CBS 116435]